MESKCLMFVSIVSVFFMVVHGVSETETLLKFKNSLVIGRANALESWNRRNPPCKWTGVLCDRGFVWGLRLENLELSGSIDIEALMGLKSLRSLSFINNKFKGLFPEFKKLVALKSLYLSNNQFDLEIPKDAFDGMGWLKKLHLEQNNFIGEIPTSLVKSPKLIELRLDGNRFTGQIPEFTHHPNMLNLSNNALAGQIPNSFSTMDPKLFEGNKGLCGKPLDTKCSSPYNHSSEPKSSTKKTSSKFLYIVAAAVAALAASLIIIGVVIFLIRRRKKKQPLLSAEPGPSSLQMRAGIQESEKGQGSYHSQNRAAKKMIHTTKLSFLRDDKGKFELQDLLKASAEILGSGCFGASYKTLLSNGTVMVVKRFKHMNSAGIDEFQEHMKRLGRLNHENLLPIVAYYYKKEEKLFVSDFVANGSLAAHLHGHKSLGQPSLDWPTRFNIVKGVGRGLLYLHKNLPSLMAPHGHLKSSNVLLSEKFEPLLKDYGLIPMINEESAQEIMVAYKSPEYVKQSRVTKKTDVWGLGVLILEILTGKLPESFSQVDKESEEDLASWVRSSFKGEWTQELFDQEMGKTSNCEAHILNLMRIGLSCCEVDVEKRLDIREAVEKMEDLMKEREQGDDDFYSTYASEADGRSSRGLSSEGINLS
ncbi:putative pollen receptor-like kinase 2 RLK-Pelle-LRR-III family [Arabidopsis thaliana]|uniref:non-specific serine/threonine protein kinase n=3 Tax=Arabidopsis TaxID=3701 RepID=A0A178VQY1_ARATH|nr:Protein kinase domain [Arabidopsis thaliana x Arabidopsis arenosa]KAG7640649.1 Protein kinase domain [Arabidopsis suecica]OAP07585.1 PRK2A [Arabidopsis thaliana]